MELAAKELLPILQDRRVSAELFFVFRLIFDIHSAENAGVDIEDVTMDGEESKRARERLKAYFRDKLNIIPLKECIESLMEHGMLVKHKVRDDLEWDNFNPLSVSVNRHFLDKLWRYSYEMGTELWNAYPDFGDMNGKEIPLKTIRKMSCREELFTYYAKSIGHDVEEHKHVIELVKWSVENQTAFTNMGIEPFVMGRIWESVESFRKGGGTGFANASDYIDFV